MKVLKSVVSEEEKEIESNYRGSLAHSLHRGKLALDQLAELKAQRKVKKPDEESSDEVSSSDGSDGEEMTGKAIDRKKKLTERERIHKKERKERNAKQVKEAQDRKREKQYDKVELFINEDKFENKQSRAAIAKREAEAKAEKEQQEKMGVVGKGAKIGRKAYKMKKMDFQLEDELAGSLREARAVGKDDFLRERFDSVYRRNLLDVVDTEHEAEKKRRNKISYKIKARSGVAYGSVVDSLDKKNKKMKAKNDARERK